MDDIISRQAAIDALWKALYEYEDKTEKQFQESDELDVGDWVNHRTFVQNMSDIDRQTILNLPSAQRKGKWKYEKMKHILNGEVRTVRICSECNGGWFRYDLSDGVEDAEPNFCPNCGAEMVKGEEDENS